MKELAEVAIFKLRDLNYFVDVFYEVGSISHFYVRRGRKTILVLLDDISRDVDKFVRKVDAEMKCK